MKKITAILHGKRNAVLTEIVNGSKDELISIISINEGESDITGKVEQAIKDHFACEDVKITKDHNFAGTFILWFSADIIEDGDERSKRDFTIEVLVTY
jgi:hypothetical protein